MIRRLFSGRLREGWVHCGILTLFLAVVILVVHLVYPDSVYGSQTDWSNQHFDALLPIGNSFNVIVCTSFQIYLQAVVLFPLLLIIFLNS